MMVSTPTVTVLTRHMLTSRTKAGESRLLLSHWPAGGSQKPTRSMPALATRLSPPRMKAEIMRGQGHCLIHKDVCKAAG
nr:MAG: hypothetical protein 1 [Guangxi cysto-like virus 9]